MWAILASICGTVIGIVAVSAAAVLREKFGEPRRPPPAPSRTTPRRALEARSFRQSSILHCTQVRLR
jgi:hypothetical protein